MNLNPTQPGLRSRRRESAHAAFRSLRKSALTNVGGDTEIIAPAFTLIEVLLSVAIFAIVLAALNTVFFSALRLRTTTARSLDGALPLEQTLSRLRRDLQGAVPPGTNGDLAGDFKSGASVNGFGMTPNGGLEFYTSAGVINGEAPWGDLQRVFYQLRDPANRNAARGKDVVRGVTRNLLATTMEDPAEQELMSDVDSLEFACYNGTEWRDSWDTSLGDSGLPQAVRVRVQLAANTAANNASRQPIEMIVPLVIQSRTNQTQTAGGAE